MSLRAACFRARACAAELRSLPREAQSRAEACRREVDYFLHGAGSRGSVCCAAKGAARYITARMKDMFDGCAMPETLTILAILCRRRRLPAPQPRHVAKLRAASRGRIYLMRGSRRHAAMPVPGCASCEAQECAAGRVHAAAASLLMRERATPPDEALRRGVLATPAIVLRRRSQICR